MNLWVLDTDTVSLLAAQDPGVTAMALAHPLDSVTLVTCNLADFVQIDGLSIGDWST